MWTTPRQLTTAPPPTEESGPLAENTPLTSYEPNILDDFHYSETTEIIFQKQSNNTVPSYLFDAELDAAVALSDSDGREDLANQNTSNAVLDAVSNYHCGELLGACVTDGELGRLASTCHFALDCLCDLWGMFVGVDGDLSDGVIAGTDVPVVQW